MKKLICACLVLLTACAEDPEPCTVSQGADGSATITCPDGSTATVPAPPKTACSITEMDGKKVLECGDTTAVLAENGTCDTMLGSYQATNTLAAKRFGEYGCKKIVGNLQISNIDSCDDFVSLEYVDGQLSIGKTQIKSLDCFKNLKEVKELLNIGYNTHITECDAANLHDQLETKPMAFKNDENKACD